MLNATQWAFKMENNNNKNNCLLINICIIEDYHAINEDVFTLQTEHLQQKKNSVSWCTDRQIWGNLDGNVQMARASLFMQLQYEVCVTLFSQCSMKRVCEGPGGGTQWVHGRKDEERRSKEMY